MLAEVRITSSIQEAMLIRVSVVSRIEELKNAYVPGDRHLKRSIQMEIQKLQEIFDALSDALS